MYFNPFQYNPVEDTYGMEYEDVFTYETTPQYNSSDYRKLNEIMESMLKEIHETYGKKVEYPPRKLYAHYLIYSNECPMCKKIKPLVTAIFREISKVLVSYDYRLLEVHGKSVFNGVEVSNIEIYSNFAENFIELPDGRRIMRKKKNQKGRPLVRGVPLIVQNFVPEVYRVGNEKVKRLKVVPFYPIFYEGKFAPFKFLSLSFGIENRFVTGF